MLRELKARIPDVSTLELRLLKLGARFEQEIDGVETYFKQPEGQVLKIVEDNTGTYLLQLQAQDGGFLIMEERSVSDPFPISLQLTQEYGIHRILKKRRRLYRFRQYTVDLSLIDEVGDFIILVSEAPAEVDMEEVLGVAEPEYIRVPFSEL
jgi:adenylate cyclase class IV